MKFGKIREPRKMLKLRSVAILFDVSVSTIRRRIRDDPDFPDEADAGRFYADDIAAYQEQLKARAAMRDRTPPHDPGRAGRTGQAKRRELRVVAMATPQSQPTRRAKVAAKSAATGD